MTTTAATTSPAKTRTTNLREWQAAAQERISLLVMPMRNQPGEGWSPYGGLMEIHDMSKADPLDHVMGMGFCNYYGDEGYVCPFRVGDVLIGKEKWGEDCEGCVVFWGDYDGPTEWVRWFSSTNLPRDFARFRRPILSVAVKQVQEITPEEATACGVNTDPSNYRAEIDGVAAEMCYVSPSYAFTVQWNRDHRAFPWKSNPWVWMVGVALGGGGR